MTKKIFAIISIVLLLLIHLLRYNLWIIKAQTEISLFDLLGNICWIIVFILLLSYNKNRLFISITIILLVGSVNAAIDELCNYAGKSTYLELRYYITDYVIFAGTIGAVLGYNLLVFITKYKRKKSNPNIQKHE